MSAPLLSQPINALLLGGFDNHRLYKIRGGGKYFQVATDFWCPLIGFSRQEMYGDDLPLPALCSNPELPRLSPTPVLTRADFALGQPEPST